MVEGWPRIKWVGSGGIDEQSLVVWRLQREGKMSVSDNSTLAVLRDNEGSYQLLDGYAYGVGDLPVNSYEKS